MVASAPTDPQLTTIELGHATDTTLARSAAGTVTIEGNVIKTAGTEDMWVPANAMRPASTNGCEAITDVETTATRPDMQVLDFLLVSLVSLGICLLASIYPARKAAALMLVDAIRYIM